MQHRKSIGWLAAGALSEPEATAVRMHLDHCAACRSYARQLDVLCAELTRAADSVPEFPPAGALTGQVLDRIRAQTRPASSPVRGPLRQWLLSWQGAAVTASLALMVLLAVLRRESPDVGPPPQTAALPNEPQAAGAESRLDLEQPTYLAYRQAASVSVEQLDALLAKQRMPSPASPPGTPLLTAMDVRSPAAGFQATEGL